MIRILLFFFMLFQSEQLMATRDTLHVALVTRAGEQMNFFYYDNFNDIHRLATPISTSDTIVRFRIPTSQPILLVYNIRTFASFVLFPDDSITFLFKNRKLVAYNALDTAHKGDLKFMNAVSDQSSLFYGPFADGSAIPASTGHDLSSREVKINAIYHRQLDSLNKLEEAKVLSNRVLQYTRDYLRYQHYYAKYSPYIRENANSLALKDAKIDILSFKNDDFIGLFSYRMASYSYYKYLISIGRGGANLDSVFSTAALSFNLFYDAKRKSIFGPEEIRQIQFYDKVGTYSAYLEKLQQLIFAGTESGIVDADGKVVDLSKIENRLLYVDFWASWCVPCREEIKKSKTIYSHLDQLQTDYVFLAVDKLSTTWEIASREEGLFEYKHNYFVKDRAKNNLATLIGLKTIPRYCVLYNGKVIVKDAPRPTDPALFSLLRQLNKTLLQSGSKPDSSRPSY